ncbi:MAG TPA: pyridoxamine 5'-phosphate oxidase family protein, partial [Candidatus Dormibacteraeota bacterium]|nr:pyridoxamine 5'-phosphate oxidase family protein [Candidatus Dormibacteraeota bacterium]
METKNLDIYGHDAIPWSRVEGQLGGADQHRTFWLATTNLDGTPHVAGVGALWSEGKLYFVSGPRTRKSRNVASNPRCVLSASLHDIDLVVEGMAAKVTEPKTLGRLANRYRDGGWPAEVRDGALVAPYSAPSAGPGPWDLYEVTPV